MSSETDVLLVEPGRLAPASAALLAALAETEGLSAHEDPRVRASAEATIALAQRERQRACEVRARLALVWVTLDTTPQDAAVHVECALRDAEWLADDGLIAQAHCMAARLAVSRGEGAQVQGHAARALSAALQAGHAPSVAHAYSLLGIAHALLGETALAFEHFDEALGRVRPEWSPSLRACFLCDAAVSLSDVGRLEDARAYLEEALKLVDAYRLGVSGLIVRMNLGTILLALGEVGAAERMLLEGLDSACASGDVRWQAYLLGTLGGHAVRLGNVEAGYAQLRRGLELAQSCRDASLSMSLRLDLAGALEQLQRHDEAFEELCASLDVAERAGLQEQVAQVHARLADACEARGDLLGALRHFRLFHSITLRVRGEEAQRRAQLMVMKRELDLAREAAEAQRALNAQLEATNGRLRRAHERLRRQAELLARLAREDDLTGVANRRQFMAVLGRHFSQGEPGRALSIVVADADSFKRVNDRFGHPVGDEVLRVVARVLASQARGSDLVSRLGGEEFAVLLPGAGVEEAREIAERARVAVRAYDWESVAPGLAVTVSLGVAGAAEVLDKERLLALADRRLYQAKAEGRDRVVALS